MITYEELDKRIRKQYPAVLKAFVQGENLFPLYLRVNKTPDADFIERNRKLEALFQHSSHHHPFGYHIETETINRRQHGVQDEPVAFYFDMLERFLGFVDKQSEFDGFASDVQMLLQAFPILKDWLAAHTSMVLEYHGKWPQLLKVLHYFVANPKPELFARELPLQGLGTKFVEQHKTILLPLLNIVLPSGSVDTTFTGLTQFEQRFGLRNDPPRVRFRWLDADLATRYTGGLQDISTTIDALAKQEWKVRRVFIVENKASLLRADVFLTLPQMKDAMAIFGSGRAAALLASIQWMKHAEIFYWGDIDAEGFEILDNLMQFFPQAKDFCMDRETFEQYKGEWVKGSGAGFKSLERIPEDCKDFYQFLVSNNLRLEQEQVHPSWVQACLQKYFT